MLSRDSLILFGVLAMAAGLMVAGFVTYPDSQRSERLVVKVLWVDPEPTGGIAPYH